MSTMSLERRVESPLHVERMGTAYVGENGNVYVHNSDRPAVHEYHARKMDEIVKEYTRSTEGRAFHDYAASRGHSFIQLIGAGTGDLGEYTVAAVIHDGKKGVMLSNYDGKDFSTRVQEFANQYGLHKEAALEYVLTHEFGHVAGYNTESSNERFIKDYFLHRAAVTTGGERDKYMALAQVAEHREQEAAKVEYKN